MHLPNMSRSRVAPLKAIALPCLELCVAPIQARKMIAALQIEIEREFYYTDSTIVLS